MRVEPDELCNGLFRAVETNKEFQRMYREDRQHEKERNREIQHLQPKQRMQIGAPTAYSPTAYFPLVWELILSRGITPQKGQSAEDFARRALNGMRIAVVGTRAGLLQKMLEHYGASTSGVDLDAQAVQTALDRGVLARRISAEKINKVLTGGTPDAIVSHNFLAPHYWNSTVEKKAEFERVIHALYLASGPQTLHVHQTSQAPMEVRGFEVQRVVEYPVGHVSFLGKKPCFD